MVKMPSGCRRVRLHHNIWLISSQRAWNTSLNASGTHAPGVGTTSHFTVQLKYNPILETPNSTHAKKQKKQGRQEATRAPRINKEIKDFLLLSKCPIASKVRQKLKRADHCWNHGKPCPVVSHPFPTRFLPLLRTVSSPLHSGLFVLSFNCS